MRVLAHSEGAIDRRQLRTLRLAAEDGELLPEREVLGNQTRPRSETGTKRADEGDQEPEHDVMLAEVIAIVAGESAPSLR